MYSKISITLIWWFKNFRFWKRIKKSSPFSCWAQFFNERMKIYKNLLSGHWVAKFRGGNFVYGPKFCLWAQIFFLYSKQCKSQHRTWVSERHHSETRTWLSGFRASVFLFFPVERCIIRNLHVFGCVLNMNENSESSRANLGMCIFIFSLFLN